MGYMKSSMLTQLDLDRRASNFLHQYGAEYTISQIARDRKMHYEAIRYVLKVDGKLVPKSEKDMERFLLSLRLTRART